MSQPSIGGNFAVDLRETHVAFRKREWARALQRGYFSLNVETAASFAQARMTSSDIGKVRLISLVSDPMRTHRSATDARRDGDDSLVIELPRLSALTLRQGSCDQLVAPGAFAMVAASDAYTYEQPEANELHSIKLPSKVVTSRFPMAFEFLGRPISPDCPVARLFADFAVAACRRLPESTPETMEAVVAQLVELLALALTQGREHVSSSVVQANHRRQAVALLEKNFRNPELRIADIAQFMRVSERYLQKIFAERDQSPSTILRDRRLAEAKRLLSRSGLLQMSMTQIAFNCGFSDSSYFSRVFRQCIGVSPSEYVRQDDA